MKKTFIKFFIIGAGIMIAGTIIIFSAKWYPVAIVNGLPIWYRAWDKSIQATEHALIMQARASGSAFNPDPAVISVIKKNILTELIEDKILVTQAILSLPQLDKQAEQHIRGALESSHNIEKASELMYGFGTVDFHDYILLPQSRREVAQEEFGKQHINFDAWLAGAKKKARVRIFLNGYRWDGEEVK